MPSSRIDSRSAGVPELALALVGYGRMGREVERVARARGHSVVAAIHPSAGKASNRRITAPSLAGAKVAIEFTSPDATLANIQALARAGCRWIVIGTTGWKDRMPRVAALQREHRLGIVCSDNFSLGMALFKRLARHASSLLAGRAGYDPYVVEWHHRGKRDAPSGTARMLAKVIEESAPGRTRHEGDPDGVLPEGAFHVSSVRAGAIPGTHLVGFDAEGDSIEMWHVARGRGGFALGAVVAAEWVRGRTGLFTFDDVLEESP